jgi:hypothetical protein
MMPRYVYRTKLGTVPYANVVSPRPLVVGEKLWLPVTSHFKNIRPRFRQPEGYWNWVGCVVDRVDEELLFLSQW